MSKMPVVPAVGRSNLAGKLLLVGFVLFFVSWFTPVYTGQALLGQAAGLGVSPMAKSGLDAPDWLPGWGACQFAWNLLIDSESPAGRDDAWKQRLAGSSCLTNGVMLLSMLLLIARRRLLVALLLLGSAGVNASWIYLNDMAFVEYLRAGYYLWLASFALAGFGALLAAARRS